MPTMSPVTVQRIDVREMRVLAGRTSPQLFAILDSCNNPQVAQKAMEVSQTARSLFRGIEEREYWAVAPYLIMVDELLFDWIVEHLWEKPWGFFLTSEADIDSLRRHLRRFLIVEIPDGRKVLFRYYDPRILRPFLKSSSREELRRFFGPMLSLSISHSTHVESVSLPLCQSEQS